MKTSKNVGASLLLALCGWWVSPAIGQTPETKPVTLPGSFWNVTGNVSPVEKGNIISSSYLEQGITMFHKDALSLIPYVSLAPTFDSKGYDWNNRLISTVGVKAVKRFDSGMVSVAGGYANEEHFKGDGQHAGAPYIRADYWFGWGLGNGYPGSSWGIVGRNISPTERNNRIAAVYLQQGVVVHRFHGLALIPFIEATASEDTARHDWNNRFLVGAGVKVVNPDPSCGCELSVSYQREHRQSGLSASNVMLAAKFWFGWNPSKE